MLRVLREVYFKTARTYAVTNGVKQRLAHAFQFEMLTTPRAFYEKIESMLLLISLLKIATALVEMSVPLAQLICTCTQDISFSMENC